MEEYFIPETEDFKIGYECEWKLQRVEGYKWGDERVYDWQKHVITQRDFDGGEMGDDWHSLGNPTCEFRTSYLTKEQIEAEGWERFYEEEYDDKNYKHPHTGRIFHNEKAERFLSFYPELREIEIHNNLEYEDRMTWFDGKCPSINELRFIMKLLNIDAKKENTTKEK